MSYSLIGNTNSDTHSDTDSHTDGELRYTESDLQLQLHLVTYSYTPSDLHLTYGQSVTVWHDCERDYELLNLRVTLLRGVSYSRSDTDTDSEWVWQVAHSHSVNDHSLTGYCHEEVTRRWLVYATYCVTAITCVLASFEIRQVRSAQIFA